MTKTLLDIIAHSLAAATAAQQMIAEAIVTVETNHLKNDLGKIFDTLFPKQDKPAATEPAATEPAATEPAATEPAATEPAATEPTQVRTPFERIMAMLDHPKFKLRSMDSIRNKTGIDANDVIEILNDNDINYVTKHNRSGELLIGLASRN